QVPEQLLPAHRPMLLGIIPPGPLAFSKIRAPCQRHRAIASGRVPHGADEFVAIELEPDLARLIRPQKRRSRRHIAHPPFPRERNRREQQHQKWPNSHLLLRKMRVSIGANFNASKLSLLSTSSNFPSSVTFTA